MPHGVLPKSHQELDLLARIRIQIGDFEAASQLWVEASKLGSRSYEEEIRELELWKRSIEARKRLLYRVMLSFILTILLLIIGSILSPRVLKVFRETKWLHTKVVSSPMTATTVPVQSKVLVRAASPVPTESPVPSPSVEKMKPRKKSPSSKTD